MLGPQDRKLLLDALRPPDGYALDFAVGTTYSVDLLALLTAPLAFTLFDWQDAEGRPTADPLAMLEALRRHADRIAIFCQAGQILVPKQHRLLFGYLEGSLFEVAPPSPVASFHPKFWALRFTADGEPVRYRLLCLSRNLTFDRSWDTALVLEGNVIERKKAFSGNHPLGEFFDALPAMAKHEVPRETRDRIAQCAQELRRVEVELPDGFDEVHYWPLGVSSKNPWPFADRYDRLLVVSPFLSPALLADLAATTDNATLVSRLESLQELGADDLTGFDPVYSLSPSAEVEESHVISEADLESEVEQADLPLSGLHAKLFIGDRGWNASVFSGSANATSAAFGGNVEFLIELIGKKSRVGIDTFLGTSGGSPSFVDLLQPYTPAADAAVPDPIQKALEVRVERVQRLLASTRFTARVTRLTEEDLFDVTIEFDPAAPLTLPAGVTVRCWPITLKELDAVSVTGSNPVAAFRRLSYAALTSFFAFEVFAEEGPRRACVRFALNLPLVGAPSDRRERILRSLLSNPEQVLRFLMFLLSEFGAEGLTAETAGDAFGDGTAFRPGWGAVPLFESLLHALDQNPSRLDQVARLVEDLRASGPGLLPDGFDEIWQPVWEARQRGNT